MILFQEVSIDFLSTGYNEGSFSEEDTVFFFTLMKFLSLFKQAFVCLLLLLDSFFFHAN